VAFGGNANAGPDRRAHGNVDHAAHNDDFAHPDIHPDTHLCLHATADGATDAAGNQRASTSNSAPSADSDPDDLARFAVTGHVSAHALATADHGWAPLEHKRLERVICLLRFVAAAGILLLGPTMPNVGALFVLVLGVFFGGYGLLIALTWARVRTRQERDYAARFALAADISLVGFALFVFSPDPSWTIYGCGLLVIASGGFRLRNGALLAAASLSLTYVMVMAFRDSALAIPLSATQVVLHLGGYLVAGALLNAVMPELDTLRERELDTYEPILQAQDDAGEAVLMTEAGRPVFWNKAFELLTGYGADDLARIPATVDLVVVGENYPPETSEDHRPFRAQVRTRAGNLLDVDVVRRVARADDNDRRVWLLRDVTTRERAEGELREQALHDALTGLPNRTLLDDRLRSAIAVAQRQDAALTLLLLDLDGFKGVNDTWGHHVGDLVLREIASRLSGALRESDTAARLGGDEFVLLLPATPLVGALETARALQDFIVAPMNIEGKPLTVGASIGIAVFPTHGRDAEVLLAAADSAMYDAKHAGGGYRTFQAHTGPTQP
jgi:diguanylate cyclase (GGDEF)-like protein/PAS domain S-box-containing protein